MKIDWEYILGILSGIGMAAVLVAIVILLAKVIQVI